MFLPDWVFTTVRLGDNRTAKKAETTVIVKLELKILANTYLLITNTAKNTTNEINIALEFGPTF